MKSGQVIAEAYERLREAEAAVKVAKEQHERAFLEAIVELSNQYGLRLVACGSEGSRLGVDTVRGAYELRHLLGEM